MAGKNESIRASEWLRPHEAAKFLGVHTRTLVKLEKDGVLKHVQKRKGVGRWGFERRYLLSELQEYATKGGAA